MGIMPMAGLTRPEVQPAIRRKRKAGGNVAREIARRVCAVDLVKIFMERTGPAMTAECWILEGYSYHENRKELQQVLLE